MLTFNLKKEWFGKIARGEKIIEYREVKSYWDKRIETEIKPSSFRLLKMKQSVIYPDWYPKYKGMNPAFEEWRCFFVLGYTKKKLPATISKIEIVDGKDTDLHIDKLVYAIHFELEAENGNMC